MELTTNLLKRCALVTVKGRIDSSTAPKLQEALGKIIENEKFKIVVDMEEVDFISSAGLWVMVGAQKNCKRFNRGQVFLAGVSKRVQGAFDLAGFMPYFKFFKTATEAVGNF